MNSALYSGRVLHWREDGVPYGFALPLFMLWLDLDEIDQVFSRPPLASQRWAAALRFRRADYFGDARLPIERAVRDRVERELGPRPDGPIRLLTHVRTFGYAFNPVSLYYCYDRFERVQAILAEVTNTPWNERFAYVVPFADGSATSSKRFHVSPFQPMELDYRFAFDAPGATLRFEIDLLRAQSRVFHSELRLARQPLRARTLLAALLRHPLLPARLHAAIYWHAWRLRVKGARFHPHPGTAGAGDERVAS